MKYDLEERTLRFSKNCIDLCKAAPRNAINLNLVSQLVRAAGSIGANYREANNSITKREFLHRIATSSKEANEAKYWLELLVHANPELSDRVSCLIDESLQLARIFSSISKKSR